MLLPPVVSKALEISSNAPVTWKYTHFWLCFTFRKKKKETWLKNE
jgi:hypothetical protein